MEIFGGRKIVTESQTERQKRSIAVRNMWAMKFTRRVLPMTIFGCSVYMMTILFQMLTIFQLDSKHPLLLMSYTSVLHLVALPMLAFAIYSDDFRLFLLLTFLVLNTVWIFTILGILFQIYISFSPTVEYEWKEDTTHQMFLLCYFLSALVLQTFVLLMYIQIKKMDKRNKASREKKQHKTKERSNERRKESKHKLRKSLKSSKSSKSLNRQKEETPQMSTETKVEPN